MDFATLEGAYEEEKTPLTQNVETSGVEEDVEYLQENAEEFDASSLKQLEEQLAAVTTEGEEESSLDIDQLEEEQLEKTPSETPTQHFRKYKNEEDAISTPVVDYSPSTPIPKEQIEEQNTTLSKQLTSEDIIFFKEQKSDSTPQQLETTSQQEPTIEPFLPNYKRHMLEDVSSDKWKNHSKHFFILSDAGKPIFTRYGNETELNTMFSFFRVVVEFVNHGHDKIRTVVAGHQKYVFVTKGSLTLVAVAKTDESAWELTQQLEFLYAQIVFILTDAMQTYLKKRSSFDLRNLLGGTDNALYSLIHQMSVGLSFSFKSIRCLRLPKVIRNQIGEILVKHKVPKLMFSLLIAEYQLVQMARNKKFQIATEDILLLMNYVNSSNSMRISESWSPVCLPSVSSKSYTYAYVDFMTEKLCIIMICSSQDQFFDCSQAKHAISEQLLQTRLFNAILSSTKVSSYSVSELNIPSITTPLIQNTKIGSNTTTSSTTGSSSSGHNIANIIATNQELRHFVYRNGAVSQFTSPAFTPPYNAVKERKKLCRVYKRAREILWKQSEGSQRVYFHMTNREAILGYMQTNPSSQPQQIILEVYAAFSLTTTKIVALQILEQIKKYVKKEEEALFIAQYPTFTTV